jgi:UDP-N-acetyl-D-galactosamine dehydrogenase
MKLKIKDIKLAIVGLGYVGLPLALEFAKKRNVISFDIDKKRINELRLGVDKNLEFNKNVFNRKRLKFTHYIKDLLSANCYIITAPTPINKFNKPDLRPILSASEMIGKIIKRGDLIIYESTVYPGCVEESCVPVLEKFSQLKFNQDFFCGYSPERISPGDKVHTLSKIKKITSGSTPKIADLVDSLYKEIINAGTYKASSIAVAEAAKVIENVQRDLNIALVNEFSMIFTKMKIDTQEVLNAAKTKWNFMPFKPGLVGGHCIGVDPYYLITKAKSIGYTPNIILAGRKLNSNMGTYVASRIIEKFKKRKIEINKTKVLIMGLTFKENCADIRNSGIKKTIEKLQKYNCNLDLYDPWADKKEIKRVYNIHPIEKLNNSYYDGVIVAVAHNKFLKMGFESIKKLCKKNHVIYDLKNLFPNNEVDLKL